MDKWQEMRVFAAVVDAGSFVGAADQLSMSKAAVSRHIAELEQRLGVRLLHRTTRRLSLTEEGEVFDARCREILASIEDSENEVTTRSGEVSGVLKVSVPLSFGVKHLAPLWPQFMAMHPNVKLDVSLTDRVVDLIDEGMDLAIRIALLADSSLVSRQLAKTRLILCASPEYLRDRKSLQRPEDIEQHDVISYVLSTDEWRFVGTDQQQHTIKVIPRMRTNNGDTCVAAALSGAGVILQPTFLVSEHLESGRLIELLPDYPSVELGVFAVFPTRKFVLPKVRRLIEFLADALSQSRWAAHAEK
jgi:DNA-binding transcriptional LysR family regulator